MPSFEESWSPEVNWNTPAGRVLDRLVEALPPDRPWKIIVFGTSPLQLTLDPNFLSGDAAIIPSSEVEDYCRRAGLLEGQTSLYIEPCTVAAFTASADWMIRATQVQRRHLTFILPHPIDLLVSKIKRLDEKDLNALRLVQAKTGHPTEDELIVALRRVVDIYRPSFDEESSSDARRNTEILWQQLFGKPIDVRQQVIAPALAQRRANYGADSYGLREALKRWSV